MKKVEYYKDKETQGHKKMLLYIEDLKRNKHFLRDLKRYRKSLKTDNDWWEKWFMSLVEEYEQLNKKAKRFIKKYQHSWEKITKKMAEEYGLDIKLLNHIEYSMRKKLNNDDFYGSFYNDYLDMCVYGNDEDELLGYTTLPDLPLLLNPAYKNHLRAYPIRIDIHQFASKRDVLDFIEKRWERIYNDGLGIYTEYKQVRFRTRKLSQEIIDFIWDNKYLKVKKIKELLDEKFPSNNLIYYEIYKIISTERMRRNK